MNIKALSKTLFLDVQTSTQKSNLKELSDVWRKLWDAQIFKDEEIVHLTPIERYAKKAALRFEFAQIVCVSLGAILFPQDAEPILHIRSILGTEREILQKLIDTGIFTKFDKIVAHGAKTFDIPVLAKRYLANGMPVPKLIDVRGSKPWEVPHEDTMELWRFGDSAWPSLDLLVATLGVDIPQKIDSESIPALFWQGDKKSIAEFSGLEVARTVNVYVKIQEPNLEPIKYKIS